MNFEIKSVIFLVLINFLIQEVFIVDIENINEILNELKTEYNNLVYSKTQLELLSTKLETENNKINNDVYDTYVLNRSMPFKLIFFTCVTAVSLVFNYILALAYSVLTMVYCGYFCYKELKVNKYYKKTSDILEDNTKKIKEIKNEIKEKNIQMEEILKNIDKLQDVVHSGKKIDNNVVNLCEKLKYSRKSKLSQKSDQKAHKNCKINKEEEFAL